MAESKKKDNKKRVIIMGAAGRDFHNFNSFFRDNKDAEVVCFTAAQIPDIAGRKYPKALSGKYYPNGISIEPEEKLVELIAKKKADEVILAYSDLAHVNVMHKASIVIAAGADFRLMGPRTTTFKSKKPVISVCAVRTGCGKSQTTRRVCKLLKDAGLKVVAIRHPMPYGDLAKQAVQRFASYADLDKQKCTIEEREEYEPHIDMGIVVYAGVDYEKILRQAEKEADVIVWDGGNNDLPFYESDLHIVIADPHRAGHELLYHPGEANVRMADLVIINKVDSATEANVLLVERNVREINPNAKVMRAMSTITIDAPELIKGKRVLVVEDGPTLTHGEMSYGAGIIAARNVGVAGTIDPRPYAVGSLVGVFKKFKQLTNVLPAMGYGKTQIEELETTINAAECDAVIVGTPIDLRRVLKNINKPAVRVHYDLDEADPELLKSMVLAVAGKRKA